MTDIADALRTKNNTSDPINAQDFSTLILSGSNGTETLMLSLTYDELKTHRDNNNLVPGQQYRITDYVTTTSQENTQSAGHQFDIIVTADDESTLNEKARAIQHEDDTYFANSDLNVWELKYCLDNDTNRFAWADNNGKGVIYYMKDEFNNECPYDFKNIQFAHPKDTTTYPGFYYTFSTVIDGTVTDHSLLQGYCYDNVIKEYISSQQLNLNSNIFINTSNTSKCYSNSFGSNCYSNSFGSNCYSNSFGSNCYSNSFGNYCNHNSFGMNCSFNSGEYGFAYNSWGSDCEGNSFGNNFNSNSFGNYCRRNSFGNYCFNNSFGNRCYDNSFGNENQRNSLGNYCKYNSFGNYCYYNSFRVSADKTATLKDYVEYNHFDDGCSYNVIWNSDTTSSSKKLQNINVNRGILGSYNSHNMINITVINQKYEIQVANNSQGAIKIYCEADLTE